MREQRNFERVGSDKLSEHLQQVILLTERGSKLIGSIDDASSGGIGVTILQKPGDFDVGSHVTVTSDFYDFRLLGEVVYIIEEPDARFRLGIAFRNARSLRHYENLLAKNVFRV